MKHAFTLIELVFVIVVIGIVAAYVAPSFKRDELYEATHQVLEHIRYTQHLAMTENKFDPKDKKFKATSGYDIDNEGMFHRGRWQIRFRVVPATAGFNNGLVGYSVYSDFDRQGNIDTANVMNPALNPLDKKWLMLASNCSGCSDVVFLNTKYKIDDIAFSSNCQPAGFTKVSNDVGTIVFDETGRPYYGIGHNNGTSAASIVENRRRIYEYRLINDCSIVLTQGGRESTIIVKPETGYAFIGSIN